MSRDGSGNYSLPLPPVVTGTTIEATWANTTLDDIKSAMTDSLSRTGNGGMSAQLKLVEGTVSVPSFGWASEANSGMYRAQANDIRMALGGADKMRWSSANGVQIYDTTWKSILKGDAGTVESQTVRWNNTDGKWEANSNFTVTGAGVVVAASTLSAVGGAFSVAAEGVTTLNAAAATETKLSVQQNSVEQLKVGADTAGDGYVTATQDLNLSATAFSFDADITCADIFGGDNTAKWKLQSDAATFAPKIEMFGSSNATYPYSFYLTTEMADGTKTNGNMLAYQADASNENGYVRCGSPSSWYTKHEVRPTATGDYINYYKVNKGGIEVISAEYNSSYGIYGPTLNMVIGDSGTVAQQAPWNYCQFDFGAVVIPYGQLEISSLGTGALYVNAGVLTDSDPSDRKLKKHIDPIDADHAWDTVIGIEPKTFEWKSKKRGEGVQHGFIAQDIERFLPSLVAQENGYKGVKSGQLVPILWAAVRELMLRVEELEARLDS